MAERYNENFDPILLEGHTAILFGAELPPEGLSVRCVTVGALPEYQKDFGSLTAATWDQDNQDTNLEMGKFELAQLRMRVLDDIKVRLKNPSPVSQWRTMNTTFHLPMFPAGDSETFLKHYFWRASEFFTFEDDIPAFDLYSDVALTTSRITFAGWRFKLEKMGQGQGRIQIWINSWPASAGRAGGSY